MPSSPRPTWESYDCISFYNPLLAVVEGDRRLSASEQVSGTHGGAADTPMVEGVGPRRAAGEVVRGTISVEATLTCDDSGSIATHWSVDALEALPACLPAGLSPCVLAEAVVAGLLPASLKGTTPAVVASCIVTCTQYAQRCRSLARVGLHFTVPAHVGSAGLHWYGRGPHECYPDRCHGALVRRHRVQDAAALHTPYIFPGEPHLSMLLICSAARQRAACLTE